MRTMNGGYAMINLASATIHADALAALASNKPIIVYEATGAPYYADSVTTSGTNVVITKGGKTITIANDNTITNVGDIQPHLYLYEINFEYNSASFILYAISNKIITKCDTWDELYEIANVGDGVYADTSYGVITGKDGFINIDYGAYEPNEDGTTFPSDNFKFIRQII